MPIGAMIETPAAALTADALARECDFLALGTNDLAQYTLAVDRADDSLSSYYDELHPSVLRLIRASAIAATRAGIPLTICGELAANPLATEVLLGIGIRRFSVQPFELGPLKLRIRSTSLERACTIARHVLRLGSADEVRRYLKNVAGS
jgi:phosphotransferase system enzyme I (PtsI)